MGIDDRQNVSRQVIQSTTDDRADGNFGCFCEHVHFVVDEYAIHNDTVAFLSWTMTYSMKGRPGSIEATTRLRFDANGKITEYFDYWDASLAYENIPVLGFLLKRLKKFMYD